MFKALSLRVRFIGSIAAFVVLFVLGGAALFSSLENRRIEHEILAQQTQQIDGVVHILELTDSLMMTQTRAAMRLLMTRGERRGTASLGTTVQVGAKAVPNLLLGGQSQALNYELVDGVTQALGGTATLFVKSGDEFVRIATNVKTGDARAIGTVLDPKGKAMAAIRNGQAFYGVVDILGNPFLTGYEPILDTQGQTIGIWYVGYKADLDALKAVVGKSRVLQNGFIAVLDQNGKIRFQSAHVAPELVEQVVKGKDGWSATRIEHKPWGFTLVGAYPEAEAAALSHDRTLAIALASIVACGLLIGLVALMLDRLVIRPLGGEPDAAVDIANHIAAGELTVAIPTAGADKQSVMAALARMQAGLRTIVESIDRAVLSLDGASGSLVGMAERVTDGVSLQSDSTASIAATLEEMAVSVKHVADSAASSNDLAATAGTLARQGNEIVGQTVSEMHRGADAVNQSAQLVGKLDESSRQISDIVTVIKEIAEQTNLLALNAAIEAARAGEAGRGFAVVADEVRKLAERTSKSTLEIETMITGVTATTGQAIEGIESGAALVNQSAEHANAAGSSMGQIDEATTRVVHAFGEISLALKEQSVASELIANNLEQLTHLNEENTVAVKGVHDDAQRLRELASELKEAVAHFRI